ncbi:hypothetical protein [Halopolyspora algeriensis]|uniref:hypothetical protein n=1 Tax=Halopolyspora algeriensis TaxID=1500506 RepID=UPI001314B735|nr:hypothetical protein [Halopolyspora algeriensis]
MPCPLVNRSWLRWSEDATAQCGVSVVEYPLDLEAAPQDLLDQVGILARYAQSAVPT